MHTEYRPEWISLSGSRRQVSGYVAAGCRPVSYRPGENGVNSTQATSAQAPVRERLMNAIRIVRAIQVRVDDEETQSLAMALGRLLTDMLPELAPAQNGEFSQQTALPDAVNVP
jgi:hypothetical protein